MATRKHTFRIWKNEGRTGKSTRVNLAAWSTTGFFSGWLGKALGNFQYDLKGIEHWNGYTQEKFLWLPTIPIICCLPVHAHIPVCSCSKILLLSFFTSQLWRGAGENSFSFSSPAFFERSLKVRGGTENQQVISITGICFPFFDLSIQVNGYFSVPATKSDWRSIFCLYFSRIFFMSIQCKAKWGIWESLIRMTQKIFIRMAKFIWSILLYSGTHLWGTSNRVTNIFDNLISSRNDTGFKDNLHN